jgi:hypothetical protein
VYDVDKDTIAIGQPGQRTSDIPGEFTPGGIVEGVYEPGGKVVIHTMTNMPYSKRHLLDLWYWQVPHMEVTGLELQDASGATTKLAKISSTDVGTYIKQLAVTEPAVWNAYQALRKAGGSVYVVGGAIRDALLQKEPKDIDLMVTGVPSEEVNHILSGLPGRVDLTGKSFGVYRYKTKGNEVEIALPRTEKSRWRMIFSDVISLSTQWLWTWTAVSWLTPTGEQKTSNVVIYGQLIHPALPRTPPASSERW